MLDPKPTPKVGDLLRCSSRIISGALAVDIVNDSLMRTYSTLQWAKQSEFQWMLYFCGGFDEFRYCFTFQSCIVCAFY
jgi:hypothetical protein